MHFPAAPAPHELLHAQHTSASPTLMPSAMPTSLFSLLQLNLMISSYDRSEWRPHIVSQEEFWQLPNCVC